MKDSRFGRSFSSLENEMGHKRHIYNKTCLYLQKHPLNEIIRIFQNSYPIEMNLRRLVEGLLIRYKFIDALISVKLQRKCLIIRFTSLVKFSPDLAL